MNGDKCTICGTGDGICASCAYMVKHGATEETIKRMHTDKKTNEIWKQNEKIANDLGDVYYDSVLDVFSSALIKRDSKENFGYNMFCEGIRVGLDVVVPLLDPKTKQRLGMKIKDMIEFRKDWKNENRNRQKRKEIV